MEKSGRQRAAQRLDHRVLLRLAQVGAHRQADHPLGRELGMGEAQIRAGIGRLAVQRLGIVDRGRDARLAEPLLHAGPVAQLQGELGPDAIAVGAHGQTIDRQVRQQLLIARTDLQPLRNLPVEALERSPVLPLSLKDSECPGLNDYGMAWTENFDEPVPGKESCVGLGYLSIYNHSASPNARLEHHYDTDEISVIAKAKLVYSGPASDLGPDLDTFENRLIELLMNPG